MKQLRNFILSAGITFAMIAFGQGTKSAADASPPAVATSASAPGTVFRDCPDCPEMVVIPAGNFMMGSSEAEKTWAATHGGNAESVADESPQHNVSLRSFALGRYDVTRAEYAAFVRETGILQEMDAMSLACRNRTRKRTGLGKTLASVRPTSDPVTCAVGKMPKPTLLG